MSRFFARRILMGSAVAALMLSGCARLQEGKPPGPWHDAYQPLDDPEGERFFRDAVERAMIEFGEPVVPINQIIFRRTRKSDAAKGYRVEEDISRTVCVNASNGVFAVYIGEDPDHKNYHALLAHEAAHMINAALTDWYMEGVATVFSREFCARRDVGWGNWERRFKRSKLDPYARSYRMMRDLKALAPEAYPSIVRFATPNQGPWMRVDIDAWIDTLPEELREEAVEIIRPHVKLLRRRTNAQYGFAVPVGID